MSGCGREDRLADGMRATCGHRIHGPTAPAFVCRDCLTADRDRLAAELARVRSLLARSSAAIDSVIYTRIWNAGLLDEIRTAIAQPQDGTTEVGA